MSRTPRSGRTTTQVHDAYGSPLRPRMHWARRNGSHFAANGRLGGVGGTSSGDGEEEPRSSMLVAGDPIHDGGGGARIGKSPDDVTVIFDEHHTVSHRKRERDSLAQ